MNDVESGSSYWGWGGSSCVTQPSLDPFLPGLLWVMYDGHGGSTHARTDASLLCWGKGGARCLSVSSGVSAHPQHGHHLLQLLVEEVDEALLPLDEDGAPGDLALAVGDEFVESLHLLVQLCQRLLVHVYFAVGVGDVQGGLGDIAVDF